MAANPTPVIERCPGPSYQDIMRADNQRVSDVLALDCNPPHDDSNIPFERYTSRTFFDREMKQMWSKVWQYACREEHVPEVGDYHVYEIGRYSVLITRSEHGLKAYRNSCLHRGTKLKPSGGMGWSPDIRCPFHGWTWNLDGTMKHIPCKWDFSHVDPASMSLSEVLVDTWSGFIFINMDLNARPLMEYLGVIPDHWKRAKLDLSGWYVHTHVRKLLPGNWKAGVEVFMEGYHTPTAHPQSSVVLGDINMQHDIFGDHVTRALTAMATPSPASISKLTEQELLDTMLLTDRSVVGEALMVAEGETARSAMAHHLRKLMGDTMGDDPSVLSIAEIIDSNNYNLFPNLFLSGTVALPMVQQFRPLPDDPDHCIFDQMNFRPRPADGSPPPVAEVVFIGEHEKWTSVKGLDPFLAGILDQDTEIVRAQREGMYASAKGEETLSRYQESRIRHLHNTLDKYLGPEPYK